jgi:hypothetical protein
MRITKRTTRRIFIIAGDVYFMVSGYTTAVDAGTCLIECSPKE